MYEIDLVLNICAIVVVIFIIFMIIVFIVILISTGCILHLLFE